MFHGFVQWFGQTPSFPVVAVDILFFLIGFWFTLLQWEKPKKVLLHPICALAAGMVLQYSSNFFLALLSVLCCGFGTMALLGALVSMGFVHLLRTQNERDRLRKAQEQQPEQ